MHKKEELINLYEFEYWFYDHECYEINSVTLCSSFFFFLQFCSLFSTAKSTPKIIIKPSLFGNSLT